MSNTHDDRSESFLSALDAIRPCGCCGKDNMPHYAGLEMCDNCADETAEATRGDDDEFDHERDNMNEVGR